MYATNLVFRFATQHVRDSFKSPVRVVREAAALAGLVATKLVEHALESSSQLRRCWPAPRIADLEWGLANVSTTKMSPNLGRTLDDPNGS